ncbi:hypothetical protein SAMN05444156_0467 [Verrucomicrobium sp. GAS474]|uniref:hypothetical protein n=1 Tax=Verrucomicrobium sp. GAS474 TaxID=1882831 RepID=UPI00087D462C|nr:hypothetical protein [Verrucomicrobium sp. GAS474]SDT89018.1 hypothetical protein SAMN05444156_0467 [Verrucomicrobium sp. GAS474]
MDEPPSATETFRRLNQEASDWMHRGMDLLPETSPAALEEAIRCFDRAIALRRTLPLEENPFFRYGLSAGWINRGDAFARLGTAPALNDAVHSYDEALALLETLPLGENPLYPRRLAIAKLNRGVALQRQSPPRDREAALMFRAALDTLAAPAAAAVEDRPLLRASALANLAGALAGLGAEAQVTESDEAYAALREALALARPAEQSDLLHAEVALKARHALCRLVVRDFPAPRPIPHAVVAEATDAVDEALALARQWKEKGRNDFEAMARTFFHFGCWIYGRSLPRFLAEFLAEAPDLAAAPEMAGAVADAITAALASDSAALGTEERAALKALAE